VPRSRLLPLLLAIVGAVHAPAWFGGFVWDDRLVIETNAALQSGDLAALLTRPFFTTGDGYWRPLTSLVLCLGDSLGGAVGIHVLAWCAHLVATFFAWRIANVILDDPRRAFFAALLFGLHPAQVEGVAWASAINDPLFWCFGLAAVDAALRGNDVRAAASLLLALLAKENAIALLPVAALARWQLPSARLRAAALLALAAAVWWLLRSWVFGGFAGGLDRSEPDPTVAAHRFAAAIELFGRELELLAWPWPQSSFRSLALDGSTLARAAAWAVAWSAAFAFAWWRGHRRTLLCLGLVGAQPLLAALHGDRLGAYPVADRYLGPSVLGASLLVFANLRERTVLAVGAALAAIGAIATVLHTTTFRDQDHFVTRGLATAPDDPTLHTLAGNAALERGDLATATARFEAALARTRTTTARTFHRAAVDARIGLGWCALRSQPPTIPRAREHFQQALALDETAATAWIGLGVARGMAGDSRTAESALRRAVALAPANSQAHYNLAFLLAGTGRAAEARASAETALRADPNNADARRLLDQLK